MLQKPLPNGWTEDATWLVQAIDPRARLIRLVRMDEEAYRAASFLDDRMLKQRPEAHLGQLDLAMAEANSLSREDARWIFHIGHVGSTLVSRLLGELSGVLAVREPRSLRDLAVAEDEERPKLAQGLRRLFSRALSAGEVALIKTTSAVSEQAPLLVPADGAALFLYATPRNYVAGILAGMNSLKELALVWDKRTERLRRRGIELVGFDASDAHRAAAAWACEMTSLEAAAEAMADRRILWADFDSMLGDMTTSLERCADHFGLSAPRSRLEELVAGPLLHRYSKALEYDYSPSLRAELLAGTQMDHQADIDAAMAALENAARSAPLLDRALRRARGEL